MFLELTASFNHLVSLNAQIHDNDQEEKSADEFNLAKINELNNHIYQIMNRNKQRDLLFEDMQDDIQSITEQIAIVTVG